MTYTQAQYDDERARFERSAGWELDNIRRALNLFPILNTPADEARLAAVLDIIKSRKGNR